MTEIIQFLGGAAIFIGAVAWLARSIVTHLLSKDIEVFKQTLSSEAERDLAKFRSSLELENEKIRIKLSALEERRIVVLEELYLKLNDFSVVASNFTYDPEMRDSKEIKEYADKFIEQYYEFYNYFRKKAIFLPDELELSITKLHDSHFNHAIDISNSSDEDLNEVSIKIEESMPKIRNETSKIISAISKEFRRLLGVELTRLST